MERCGWVSEDPLYIAYHDEEWGKPERDGRALWEQLQLEGFQAGLSWITILRKREGFRAVFDGFDPARIAQWQEADVERAVQDARIVRHRGKIEATVGNARAYIAMGGAEAFAQFIWDAVPGAPVRNRPKTLADVPGQTPVSVALSNALKKQGFRFCGPTTVYAFMQAAGLVNDHVVTCPCEAG